jgi:hypothetical protein
MQVNWQVPKDLEESQLCISFYIYRKVAGSIPDGVIGIFHWHIPSGRTMVLGSTQPLTEMSTRLFPEGKGGRCVRLTTLPSSCAACLEICGASTSWNPLSLSRAVMRLFYIPVRHRAWLRTVAASVRQKGSDSRRHSVPHHNNAIIRVQVTMRAFPPAY